MTTEVVEDAQAAVAGHLQVDEAVEEDHHREAEEDLVVAENHLLQRTLLHVVLIPRNSLSGNCAIMERPKLAPKAVDLVPSRLDADLHLMLERFIPLTKQQFGFSLSN